MKMPRFFIILGACALLSLACPLLSAQPSSADPLPVMRADPWAGDPDMPGVKYQIPFDEEGGYSRVATPYETYYGVTQQPIDRNDSGRYLTLLNRFLALLVGRRW